MINELIERYPSLAVCRGDIEAAKDVLIDCYEKGGKLLLCGNGGSSADCDHIVGELMKGFMKKRRLDEKSKAEMKENFSKIDDKILEIKARVEAPKNQVITGMPRGHGENVNAFDSYLIKLERYEQKKRIKEQQLLELWQVAKDLLSENDIKKENIALLRLRFYKGYQWKVCAKIMAKDYPDSRWNINKCFREYSRVLCKIHKNKA